jgi:alkylation response protein AidB-like acyl-CoA dehydrogenase
MSIDLSPEDQAFCEDIRAFLHENLSEELRYNAFMSPTVFVEPDVGQVWNALLNRRGWLGYNWPAEHRGTGWSPLQRYLFEKECAQAGAPPLTLLSLKLVAPVIWTFGTPEQKAHYLPRILSGEDYWCQGFSEPGSGSDLASLQFRAVRDGDNYIISGTKIWTTHAHHANRIFCLVRTDPTVKKQAGLSFILIDMNLPGITVRPILSTAGDHEVNQMFFDEVVVPVANRVGEEGQGWTIAKFLLENERGGSCYAPRLGYDLDQIEKSARAQPDGRGGLLADDPQWQERVAVHRLAVEALEMIELRFVSEQMKGMKPGPQTSLSKLLASNLRQKIDLLAVELHDMQGLLLDAARPLYGPDAPAVIASPGAHVASARYLNSRAWTVFGGTNEVQSNIIAQTVLGL